MAAWLPPVNIPSIDGGQSYAAELNAGLSNIGEALYRNRRAKIADEQWQQQLALAADQWNKGYARELAADDLARQRFDLDREKFEAEQTGGGAIERYGTPQWYQMEDGTMGFGVMGKDGSFLDVPPPKGAKWAPAVTFQDTGTARVPVYTRGGGMAGEPLPIDVAGEQRQQEIGGAGGKAAAALPLIEASKDRLIGGIDDVLNDPDLASVTGEGGGRFPTWFSVWSSTREGAARAQSRIDFILGNTFLQAYNDLRGAGQITEREGQAAMEAYSRLRSQAMSDQDYVQALFDLKNEILKLYRIAQQRAQMGAGDQGPPQVQSQPQPQGQQLIAPSGNRGIKLED